MMSDDPWIMRQDPLTQLPLCPSAALKLCPVSSVLIQHLSAAVCFRHTESDRTGRERNQCFGGDQWKHKCQRPSLKRRVDGAVIHNERASSFGGRKG